MLAQELYIHDEICRRVTYEHDKNTALSALVYGKADCDGYADASYRILSNHAFVSSPQAGWDTIAEKLSAAGKGTLFYVPAPFSDNHGG